MGAVTSYFAATDDTECAGKDDADQQEEKVLLVAPYPLLLVATILFAVVPYGDPDLRPTIFVIAAVVGLWEFCWWTRPGAPRENSQRYLVAYLVGGIAMTAFLVYHGPWFAFFAWTFYLRVPMVANAVLRWIAFASVAAMLAMAQIGGAQNLSGGTWAAFGALFVVNLALAAGMVLLEIARETRHEERRTSLAKAWETNRRLEATLEENAALQEELTRRAHESGISEERARLAREIHDTIAQGLAGVVAQLEAARQPGITDPDRHVQIAHQLARESLGEARRSVEALRPQALTGSRFSEAVARMAKQWGEVNDISVEYAATGEPRALSPDLEVALFRVGQEALANVAKHAGAREVRVSLSYLDDAVALEVSDDGAGFDADQPPPSAGGYGIGVMRERIARLGGYFEIESSAGDGTTVSAVVPAGPIQPERAE